jgi:hypothetical protein
MKKKLIILSILIVVVPLVFRLLAFKSVNFEILDKETNAPIENVKTIIVHEFFLQLDPSWVSTKKLSDINGRIKYYLPRTEVLKKIIFYKDGYYPLQCDFFYNSNNRCGSEIYLNRPDEPFKDITFTRIELPVYDRVSANKIEHYSLYQEGQNDIGIIFIKNDKMGYDISKIFFEGVGGIQSVPKNEGDTLSKVTEAPIDGYLPEILGDLDSKIFIFKTADGKHYGKFLYDKPDLKVVINLNENERDLVYEIEKDCIDDFVNSIYGERNFIDYCEALLSNRKKFEGL